MVSESYVFRKLFPKLYELSIFLIRPVLLDFRIIKPDSHL